MHESTVSLMPNTRKGSQSHSLQGMLGCTGFDLDYLKGGCPPVNSSPVMLCHKTILV